MKQDSTQHAWTPPLPANTTFLVLCGGQGLRMGGADKPLLAWHGQPMIDRVLSSVPADMAKLISANRNLTQYAQRGHVVEDATILRRFKAATGPLVGIMAAFEALAEQPEQRWLLISPGDTPCLPRVWWQVMQQTAADKQVDAVVAFDGERQQHLHLLAHRRLAESLRDYLRTGHKAVYVWLESVHAERACFDDPQAFRNVNQPADLQDPTA
jgi:molybdopterin-guanine dinucleotide biosynthesis protein A